MGERISAVQVAGLASIGAGAIHAAAAGIHAEHQALSQLFVALAAAQLTAGVVLLLRAWRLVALVTALLNLGALVGWSITRVSGISWIDGLERSEAPQFADTVAALLAAAAVVAGTAALVRPSSQPAGRGALLALPAVAVGAVAVAAMFSAATHVHSHDETAAGGHDHSTEAATAAAADAATAEPAHDHGETEAADAAAAHDHSATESTVHEHPETTVAEAVAPAWPRPWDPTRPIDFSGVPGVTAEQQGRAEALARSTMEQLPQFADVTVIGALGFRSIGDASTGFEHHVNIDFIRDDSFLDPSRPESLVYQVDGDARTLVSAMFIAKDTKVDDPGLVDYGGPLMQWHVHENLCWGLNDAGEPVVVGVTDESGACEPGSVNAGGDNPMVHVWIAAHECGPFAALEGHGAGQTAGEGPRADQCAHDHGATGDGHAGHEAGAEAATVPYDPTKPIDLSGVPGVTPEQQAYAENLVAVTVTRLSQWSDPAVAEAAGFHSIGDGDTGFEHYIQWEWINDEVWLDPDAPESLVYVPQPDGSRQLVSAMYMLPDAMPLADVPDWGGPLMQWHVHDDLCYTPDPVAPQVRGLVRPDGTCRGDLILKPPAPMIHVWITPHECGPFAALEGVGAGAIEEGAERWCDHAHGSP